MKVSPETARVALSYLRQYAEDGNIAHAAYQVDVQLEAIRPYTARHLERAGAVLRRMERLEGERLAQWKDALHKIAAEGVEVP